MAIKLGIVAQIHNEELLIGAWLDWHMPIADYFYLILHNCTDKTEEIIKEKCPGAKLFYSDSPHFDAGEMDRNVSQAETLMKQELNPDWILALNPTEFIFTPNFKEELEDYSLAIPDIQAFGMRSFSLVDLEPNDSLDLLDHTEGYVDYERGVHGARRWRFVHNQSWGHYELGRHGTGHRHITCPELLLAYWQFAPYPLCKKRKQQVGPMIQGWDRQVGNGFQHLAIEQDEGFYRVYGEECARSYNLLDFPLYKEYYDIWRQRTG